MNSRLYELLRKYEHRGVSLYWGDDVLSIFTEGLGGIVTDDEDALYAEVERWFSGEAG